MAAVGGTRILNFLLHMNMRNAMEKIKNPGKCAVEALIVNQAGKIRLAT